MRRQRWWNRRRLDVVEVVLVVGTAVLVMLWWSTRPSLHWEADTLADRYGPSRNSQFAEEWIIRDFFGDKRGGMFVDIGAGHHQTHSNTHYLETALGWHGIAVDAQSVFAADYAKYRPRTQFFSFFVADSTGEQATLWLSEPKSGLASGTKFQAEQLTPVTPMAVPTIRLDDLLDGLGVHEFDLLSMDIELAEPSALAGFTIDRFRPTLVCIEAHLPTRQAVLDYFSQYDYVLVGKYLRADDWNLYFTRARLEDPHFPRAALDTPSPTQTQVLEQNRD